ncbi:MAG: electron transfer flavoprotein subunit alpha/FixB family protein [Candidatus Heimdallarchaeota archaeon]|nr:electron transfer flavoprotein subunit alpha/FixB family protein [Candidatus Heimdallarchaeota archaeon]
MSEEEAKLQKRIERDKDIPYVDLRDGARGIITWAQMNGPHLSPAALEIIGEATRVGKKMDEDSRTIISVIIGKGAKRHAETLIHHGANIVYVIDDERLEYYQTLPFARAMIDVIKAVNPEIGIFSATTLGRDLAPRVAATLNVGLSADCTELDIGYYANKRKNQRFAKAFKMIRPSFGESKLATIIGPWNYPTLTTARPGVFRALKSDTSRNGEIIDFTPNWAEGDFAVKVLETTQSKETLDLSKADIIVSGGLGIGKEGFSMLRELVDLIRSNDQIAEVGASRAAVDAGYIEYKHQIGQTGKTVRPQIYIAVGISGAIQHIAGMKDSKTIIAINKDSKAKIFDHTDYGIVADYQDAIPPLIEKIKSGFRFPLE